MVSGHLYGHPEKIRCIIYKIPGTVCLGEAAVCLLIVSKIHKVIPLRNEVLQRTAGLFIYGKAWSPGIYTDTRRRSDALFIVVKYESVHADRIAFLNSRLFKIGKDSGLL